MSTIRSILAAMSLLACCVFAVSALAQSPPSPPSPAPPPAAPAPVAFEEALLKAANDLFSKAPMPDGGAARIELTIDPLIDGVTGAQSVATRGMERRLVDLVRKSYPRFDVKPFNTATVARAPVVLIGTFTAINAAGQAQGPRDAYRICLALADLRTQRIVSKGFARARPEGIDPTPVAFFADAPVWTADPSIEAYVKSCQGTKAGDPINAVYAERIQTAAYVSDAINAYGDKRYKDSLELYKKALAGRGGEQLRVHNGIYLTATKLNRRQEAEEAFAKVVELGLTANKLGIKFLFKPGTTHFVQEKAISGPYAMWLQQVAKRSAARGSCLEIVGHTSPTGPEPLNERLSLRRAEFVRDRLKSAAPDLVRRMIASGVGSREVIVGTGKDNASDALDRRVEFKAIAC